MKMLKLEYDLQHHLILSRRNLTDHLIIRLILSALATPKEIANLSRRDLKQKGKKYSVQLLGEKKRISPLDEQTFTFLSSMEGDKLFKLSEKEIDDIVSKYSPKDKKYNARSLKKAMIMFLKDSALFELSFETLSTKELEDFMYDFNPLYSGAWLDEEGLREFVLNYALLNNITDPEKIAEETGLEKEFIASTLKDEKSIFFLAEKFDSKRFIS